MNAIESSPLPVRRTAQHEPPVSLSPPTGFHSIRAQAAGHETEIHSDPSLPPTPLPWPRVFPGL